MADKWDGIIPQGNDLTLELTVSGTTDNITDWTIYFTVKKNASDEDAEAVISKSTAEATEVKVTDGANQKAEIYLLPADTRELDAGDYVHDVKVITKPANKEYTVVKKEPFIIEAVVRRGA